MDKIEVLRKAAERWTKSVSLPMATDDQIQALAGLCTQVEYEAGKIIEMAGAEAKKFYVIGEGLVSISIDLGRGHERKIQTASRYEVVGWSALVPPYRYRSTITAVEKTKMLVFNGQDLRKLHRKNPALAYALYVGLTEVLAERLHNTFLQLADITS
ncbi:MAG: cyclic nucleotide-binding domain-containing protein [Dehalococcoidia bacterium]|nr:cyclic nucleotide-binding domain-containing protein [Dehalococcoidia bacterium]